MKQYLDSNQLRVCVCRVREVCDWVATARAVCSTPVPLLPHGFTPHFLSVGKTFFDYSVAFRLLWKSVSFQIPLAELVGAMWCLWLGVRRVVEQLKKKKVKKWTFFCPATGLKLNASLGVAQQT